jgi:hypothetical protein
MKEVTSETIILNNSAENHPSTLNPGTISAAHLMMRILMTKRNIPNVKMVIGIVRIINIGFTKVFSNPKTTATNMAVTVLSMCTPDKIKAAAKTATDVINIFERNCIMLVII